MEYILIRSFSHFKFKFPLFCLFSILYSTISSSSLIYISIPYPSLLSLKKMASTTRAIVTQEPGKAVIDTVPVPKLRDDYLIVKVKAVALNPTDWKHIAFLPTKGIRIGCGM